MNNNFEIIGKSGISEGRILYFTQLPSTQNWILKNIDLIVPGDVIWTSNQTAGKGRLHKKWITLPHACLTFSLIVKAFSNNTLNTLITQISAVTVGDFLESLGIKYVFKWPNDILINNKKVAGIKADYQNILKMIIIGIGINVNLSEEQINTLPVEQSITSLQIERHNKYDMKNLLFQCLSVFKQNLDIIPRDGKNYFLDKLRKNSYLKRRDILQVKVDNKVITGNYQGIDTEGRIQIQDSKNHLHKFWSGELITL